MRIGETFKINQSVFADRFCLVDGTTFTIVGRAGRGYVIELHNKIHRQITVGNTFFANARCSQVTP